MGGNLGGPVKKDKLFFFFNWDGVFQRNTPDNFYTVPTDDIRGGDFSSVLPRVVVYDPATQVGTDARTRKPFASNIIPRARISPIFDKIQNLLPLPNQVNPNDPNNLGGNYFVSAVVPLNRNMYDVKANYNATSKLAVWGKFSRMGAPVDGRYPFGEETALSNTDRSP